MKNRMYVVYDRVAEEGGPVFVAVNDGVARRQYRALLQQVSPVDIDSYKLYLVGEYDTDSMEVQSIYPPLEVVMQIPQGDLFEKGVK